MLTFAISTPLVFGESHPSRLYSRRYNNHGWPAITSWKKQKKKHKNNNNRFSISPERQCTRETIYISVPSTAGALCSSIWFQLFSLSTETLHSVCVCVSVCMCQYCSVSATKCLYRLNWKYKGEVSLNLPRWRLQSPATSAFLFVCFTLCVCVCARVHARLHTTGADMQLYYVLTWFHIDTGFSSWGI